MLIQPTHGILVFIVILALDGCGYTVLRDFAAEATEAEYAVIDSLDLAPDLTITNIEYEYIPSPPRGQLSRDLSPPKVQFYITVRNIGNTEFTNPYVLVFRNLSPRQYEYFAFGEARQNQRGETIPVNGDNTIKIWFDYPMDRTTYIFTLLTNSIIQHELIDDLGHHENNPVIPPLSREFYYDNNEASIRIPGWKDIIYRER
jgi:hypothetical protein